MQDGIVELPDLVEDWRELFREKRLGITWKLFLPKALCQLSLQMCLNADTMRAAASVLLNTMPNQALGCQVHSVSGWPFFNSEARIRQRLH